MQLLTGNLWNINTVTGEQFPEIAAGMPRSNADFTVHYIDIREGIYWSDGMPLTAHDVAFAFNMILSDPNLGGWAGYNAVLYSVEAISDTVVRLVTHESFPRIALTFGVTVGGNMMRIVPAHIYRYIDDVAGFADNSPVVAGAYTVHSYDPLGTWVLYQRRDDWYRSITSVVAGGAMPNPQYILFRSFGDDTARQMAMINNEIAPFDNRYFRWGVALALDFDMLSLAIFEGIGRASPFPVFTMTSGFLDMYYRPYLMDWIDNWYFEGQPFVMEMTYLSGTELQTERSVIAAFNQLQQFGFNATLAGKTIGAWGLDWGTGNFQVDGYWPWGFMTRDVFTTIQPFDRYLITPVGEWTTGHGMRWDNVRFTEIIHEMSALHPDNYRTVELAIEAFQVAVHDLPAIGFHSGLKFVPTNATYWGGFPTADNP